jgi:hypothetical protein
LRNKHALTQIKDPSKNITVETVVSLEYVDKPDVAPNALPATSLVRPAGFCWGNASWLCIGTDFLGATPEGRTARGVQLEAILSYNVTRSFSVGVGGRYWSIGIKDHGGTDHFEVSAIGGGFPQDITFKTERYGGFVQASYIFGAPIVAAKY